MRYALSTVIATIIMATAVPAFSHTREGLQGEVSIELVTGEGRTLGTLPYKDFWKNGSHIFKTYLEARKGMNYGIIVRNSTPERLGMVIAVDGRNIISGKQSRLANTENMYVLNAYEQGRYDGWRTDKNTVHRFYFTESDDSYTMRTFGDASSMGVIAVAVFREKDRPKPMYESRKKDMAPAAPSAESAAGAKAQGLLDRSAGTGFGDAQHSPVMTVAFEPEHMPVQETLVKYEWRETLCRKGILRCGRETGNRLWDHDEYAPFPPGYPLQ